MTAVDEAPAILGADIAQPASDPAAVRARIEQTRLAAEGRAGARTKGK